MNNYVFILVTLSLFVSNFALAQHSGTEQEQRVCAGNVQRYCRSILDQGDFAVLACLQQHREKLSASCRKVLTGHGQ